MRIPFIALAVMAAAMAVVTFLPGGERLYSSAPFIAGWALTALTALAVMLRRRLYRRPALFILHVAFLVILAGALLTHLQGTSERVHLRVGESAELTDSRGGRPLRLTLDAFRVVYYPGTRAPQDYESRITACADGDTREYTVAMNRVARIDGYRLYQTSYDSDALGTVLTVARDPLGTTVSYTGYAMLLLAMLLTLLPRRPRLRPAKSAKAAAAVLLVAAPLAARAQPRTLPADVAARFAPLAVEHGGRVAPFSTLAREFSVKVMGSASWRGLTPEQVLTGWFFFYDDWERESGVRLQPSADAKANERLGLVAMAASGSLFRLFPVPDGSGATTWYSPVDNLPDSLDTGTWTFTRHSLNYLAELAAASRWDEMGRAVDKIARRQLDVAPQAVPGRLQRVAERWLGAAGGLTAVPGLLMLSGIAIFVRSRRRACQLIALSLALLAAAWTAGLIAADWLATRRLPLANGPETMLWLALSAAVVGLVAARRHSLMLPASLIVAGAALMVAALGLRNPQLTPLMPVLRSPLLSVHVLCIMLAYALFALIAVCCVASLSGREGLVGAARRMLRPAVGLLAAGIFIGAVWADNSWGRYWGWDPKEVWALVTMIVYCLPLHTGIIAPLRSDRGFAVYCTAAFVCVLFTYFGVNFILGGLHSYA